jgi:hypothetical protein
MKSIIKAEEAFMLILAIVINSNLSFPTWLFWVLFLTPDISMLGYVVNNKVGAITYNIFHHKGLAIVIYLVGLYLKNEALQFVGLLLFGHSAFDRMLGYGLKYSDSFHHTHLGFIGKQQHVYENQ